MSVPLACPACAGVLEFHRPPVRDCSRCGAELPASWRLSASRALRESRAPRPTLLMLGQFFSLAGGVALFAMLFTARFDAGSYAIDGATVPGPELLRRAGWLFALGGALLLAIGIGLWRERGWARPLTVTYWFLAAISLLDQNAQASVVIAGVAMSLVAAAIAGWYLYLRPNVRACFDARALSRNE